MYRITPCLSVGPFPYPERISALVAGGVTHILNVSSSHSTTDVVNRSEFRGVEDVLMVVEDQLPETDVLRALDRLFEFSQEPLAHVYVHCLYGQQRSPTVLWLFLIACGLEVETAREMISSRAHRATPGYSRLVGPGLVLAVQRHGQAKQFHKIKENAITPFQG